MTYKFIKNKCSIIIRTKNEERWINSCLNSIFNQKYNNFEIIIVDNNSSDKTIEKVKKYKIKKIININKYLPGKSLNLGIKKSQGEFIVCISAHCIPTNIYWLSNLVKSINSNEKFAGVYGRQQPMNFSSLSDKRDLLITFGLDKKIQVKDSFFHNANSIIRKSAWDKINFDESVTNIEDRLWAGKILKKKMNIVYDPSASVYHYHGIHQNTNIERLSNTVNIIEQNDLLSKKGKININNLQIIAIIPLKGPSLKFKGVPLIKYTKKKKKNPNIYPELLFQLTVKNLKMN